MPGSTIQFAIVKDCRVYYYSKSFFARRVAIIEVLRCNLWDTAMNGFAVLERYFLALAYLQNDSTLVRQYALTTRALTREPHALLSFTFSEYTAKKGGGALPCMA
jgi:hypothetical protein